MERQLVEIDLEVHKWLEERRKSFAETPNDILRRELGIEAARGSTSVSTESETPHAPMSLSEVTSPSIAPISSGARIAWQKQGIKLPERTEWRFTQGPREYSGYVSQGYWWHGAEKYRSPSGLASALWTTKAGAKTKIDGWSNVLVKRPGDSDWRTLNRIQRLESEVV